MASFSGGMPHTSSSKARDDVQDDTSANSAQGVAALRRDRIDPVRLDGGGHPAALVAGGCLAEMPLL